jgi:hypothetical protein
MKTFVILILMTTLAFAQDAPPPASPQQQALVQKLMEEINTGIQLRAELLKAQQQLKDLQEKQCDAKPAMPSGN